MKTVTIRVSGDDFKQIKNSKRLLIINSDETLEARMFKAMTTEEKIGDEDYEN